MYKLLSLVLSVSMVVSSITPAMGQVFRGRGARGLRAPRETTSTSFATKVSRRVFTQQALSTGSAALQARILAGGTKGVAQSILTQSSAQRTKLLRNDFVSLSLIPHAVSQAERMEAISFYKMQLNGVTSILTMPQQDLPAFLELAKNEPAHPTVLEVQGVLADAAALSLIGSREHAPLLLDFYYQAQGTIFEDTAALITARGLLRMQAYAELEGVLAHTAKSPALAGVRAYVQKYQLPVEVPTAPEVASGDTSALADFLGADFSPNRLHADYSLAATEQWMDLGSPLEEVPEQMLPAGTTDKPAVTKNTPAQTPTGAEATVSDAGTFAAQPLVLTPMPHPQVTLEQPATPAAAPVRAAASPVRSTEGILYSGIPVFAMADGLKRGLAWVKRKFAKEKAAAAPYEEPGLHENTLRPVYMEAEVPETAQIGGDLVGTLNEGEMVPVGADGFKLTVEGEDKVEHILHNVDLTVSTSLKNFSSEYNRLALDTNHIFELRNQTIPAKRPDHFYFALSTAHGEFEKLLQGAKALSLPRPMRIKIQRTGTPKKSITLPVVDMNLQETALVADVDTALLGDVKTTEGGQVLYHNNTLYFRSAEGELTPLENSFIRLPKEESKHWTKILAMYPETSFTLGVFSTMDKMPPVTYLVPSLQIGLGKTLAPVLNDMSTMGETTSSAIMLGINNVLPALMGFVHPLLKKYGEAAVFRVGASMFTAGGLIALASGLYGHVGADMMSDWQLAGFLASSVLIALGTNITRFVQNIIISANRGIVPQNNSFKKKLKPEQNGTVTYNVSHVLERAKEVLTKKSTESLRDVVYYQRGAMFKNLGTMLFLSFPWLANLAGKAVLGVDLGLDFSASYVPYTLYSLYTLHKLSKIPYKDAFPLNVTLLKNNVQDAQNAAAVKIAEIKPEEMAATHPIMQEPATHLKGAIDALVPVESRKTKKAVDPLTLQYEAEAGKEVEQLLLQAGRTEAEAAAARQSLQKAFDLLGHRDIKLKDVARMPGLPSSLAAMTLATLGELGLSNGLAFAMRELVGNGTAATGIVGILLYGCMFGWRIVGNVLSQRMSGGSMYALSSAAGVLGPMMMALSGGNVATLVSGAIIACFGISNFFSQMYEYMVGLHPKYKREIALLINYTMPAGAVGASLLRLSSEVPGLDMGLAGAALAASVALTPGMLANSSVLRMIGYEWGRLKTAIKNFFHRGDSQPPLQEASAQ